MWDTAHPGQHRKNAVKVRFEVLDNGAICGKIQAIKAMTRRICRKMRRKRDGDGVSPPDAWQRAVSEPAAMSRTPHPRYRMTEMTAPAVN